MTAETKPIGAYDPFADLSKLRLDQNFADSVGGIGSSNCADGVCTFPVTESADGVCTLIRASNLPDGVWQICQPTKSARI